MRVLREELPRVGEDRKEMVHFMLPRRVEHHRMALLLRSKW